MFEEEKYQTAAKKAMNFIKAQMDINHFTHKILFAQEYGAYYSGDVMLGTIEGFSGGEALGPTSISCPFYDFGYTGTVSGTGGVTVLPPTTSGSSSGNAGSYTPVKYTAVTKDLYYSGGYLGTLKIPTLGLSVKVYQGTDADALRKGAGHFASTSIWEGNVAIAGHNRGVNNHFGKIHTLDIGYTIKLTTQLGTRSYEVYSVSKIGVDDTSVLNDSTENIITLVTCVMNQPDYRWCVQARQK